MKKILIAGGAGFIGSHLTEFCLSLDHEVWTLDNFLTGSRDNLTRFLDNSNFHLIEADLTDADLGSILNNTAFDLIYHLASPASPKQYFRYPLATLRVNSQGTDNLLTYGRKIGRPRFVYASTSEVYGDPEVHPQKEDYWGHVNPVGIRACYDEGKRFGEALCTAYIKQYKFDIRIARIFNTYGPYMEVDDGRVVSNFITQALKNQPLVIYGDGRQTRSFCYVSDLVGGLYLLGEKEMDDVIVNLGNPEEKTILEIAYLIKKLTASDSPIIFEKERADDPKKRKPDIARARTLGFAPTVKLDTGLTLTIAYFRQKLRL